MLTTDSSYSHVHQGTQNPPTSVWEQGNWENTLLPFQEKPLRAEKSKSNLSFLSISLLIFPHASLSFYLCVISPAPLAA